MLFYKPNDGYVGDIMPYYMDGEYIFFYLKTKREGEIFSDVTWHMVKTKDFMNYYDDKCLGIKGGTGSVLKIDDTYNVFYCDNSDFDTSEFKKQYACHAVTKDFDEIVEVNRFHSRGSIYEAANFRDPHVFWNEEKQEYWMLLASRTLGKTNRKGCVGLYTSKDLESWEEKRPLYAPRIDVGAHECPDLFKIGDWWYLTYSSYTGFYATVYRMSRSQDGPWEIPSQEMIDTRCFYAGKTVSDGKSRYIVGWNPTKEAPYYSEWNPSPYDGNDYNIYDWAGNIEVHQLVQNDDGTLGVKLPDIIENVFNHNEPIVVDNIFNDWQIEKNNASILTDKFSAVLMNNMSETCLVKANITFNENVRRCGLILRGNQDIDKAYYITLNMQTNCIEFTSHFFQGEAGWQYMSHEVDLQRPYRFKEGITYEIKVVIDGSILIVYFNEEVALSARVYDLSDGRLGIYTIAGEVEFKNIELLTI